VWLTLLVVCRNNSSANFILRQHRKRRILFLQGSIETRKRCCGQYMHCFVGNLFSCKFAKNYKIWSRLHKFNTKHGNVQFFGHPVYTKHWRYHCNHNLSAMPLCKRCLVFSIVTPSTLKTYDTVWKKHTLSERQRHLTQRLRPAYNTDKISLFWQVADLCSLLQDTQSKLWWLMLYCYLRPPVTRTSCFRIVI